MHVHGKQSATHGHKQFGGYFYVSKRKRIGSRLGAKIDGKLVGGKHVKIVEHFAVCGKIYARGRTVFSPFPLDERNAGGRIDLAQLYAVLVKL